MRAKTKLKDDFKCTHCDEMSYDKESVTFNGMITDDRITLCKRCFIREFGKKAYLTVTEGA